KPSTLVPIKTDTFIVDSSPVGANCFGPPASGYELRAASEQGPVARSSWLDALIALSPGGRAQRAHPWQTGLRAESLDTARSISWRRFYLRVFPGTRRDGSWRRRRCLCSRELPCSARARRDSSCA